MNDFVLFGAGEPFELPLPLPLEMMDGVDGDSIDIGIRVSSYVVSLLELIVMRP